MFFCSVCKENVKIKKGEDVQEIKHFPLLFQTLTLFAMS